jgi:hypothetical protein
MQSSPSKKRIRMPAPIFDEHDDRRNPLLPPGAAAREDNGVVAATGKCDVAAAAAATSSTIPKPQPVFRRKPPSPMNPFSSSLVSSSGVARTKTVASAVGWWRWGRRGRFSRHKPRGSRARKGGAHDFAAASSGRSTVLLGHSYEDRDLYDTHNGSDSFEGLGFPGRSGSPQPIPPSFSENDWTPLDTSYGAAIPVGGWIPKTIRRLIECCILAALIGTLVGMVVMASIKLHSGASSAANGGGGSGGNASLFDDDMYINGTNASWYGNATDDDLVV